jgi:acyl-homoserine-lactone acylase
VDFTGSQVHFRAAWLLSLTLFITACSDSSDGNGQADQTYRASVVRTSYGIPHVTANDWGSLGYGYGYAFAQDNFCVLMKEVLYASGRSAEFLGQAGDLQSDFVYQWVNGDEEALRSEWIDAQDQKFQDLVIGYARGLSRYFNETGVDQLAEGPEGCRGAPWARAINEIDLVRVYRKSQLQAGIDNGVIRHGITDVRGPDMALALTTSPSLPQVAARKVLSWSPLPGDNLFDGYIDPASHGSNFLALGGDYTQSGRGMVLGNPHQPWQGTGRWHELHLTIPGEYDVMGATLLGLPMITIGFNKDLAWSHTVSPASHIGLYELVLNPTNPMQYLYDGEYRDISTVEVSAKQLESDDSLSEHQFTIYLSHYGPIINLTRQSALLDGWPMTLGGTSIIAVRDPNLNNARGLLQWMNMGQASNMAEFSDALKSIGLPWVHTAAADRHGDVLYADASVIPRVTAQQLDLCIDTVITQSITNLANRLFFALNGSRSECEWGRSPDSPEGTNIYGYSELPKLSNRSYALNYNNSYWLTNPDTPLTGFPFLMGPLGGEGEQQFLRGNLGHQQVTDRMAAVDGLDDSPGFTLDSLQGLMLSSRVMAAEMALDDVLEICNANDLDERMTEACTLLAAWDRRVDIDSIGAHIFTEFWRAFAEANSSSRGSYFIENPEIWREPFDPARPTTTPAGIDTTVTANHDRVMAALETALQKLAEADVALNLLFGEVQAVQRNEFTIPIHGGWDEMGTFSVIKVRLDSGGYSNITGGNTYVQAVTWDESDCPVASTLLAHSQSTDPASPYYLDQTLSYSDKVWTRMPFCKDDIAREKIGEELDLIE